MKKYPVVICGAGPVGLTLSILLSRLGIQHTLIEKHPDTAIHPKARGVNVRTMEIFRQIGIESEIRQHELPQEVRRLLWIENLQGNIISEVTLDETPNSASPTRTCLVSQDKIEEELFKAAQSYDECDLRFSTRLVNFTDHNTTIECTLEDRKTKKQEALQCDYLIGCDGAHSTIRNQLGIKMTGEENLGDFLSVYCKVDIKDAYKEKLGAVTLTTKGPAARNFIMVVDNQAKWIIAQRLERVETYYDNDYCTTIVQETVGDGNIPVEIINSSIWQMAALNATSYRKGNIFLAGDAAHRIPPTGGMGMNAGIQDAHNLAWKLAAVLKNEQDPAVLDTYFEERHPFNQFIIDWSTENALRLRIVHAAIFSEDMVTLNKHIGEHQKQINHLGLDIGYSYIDNHDFDAYSYQPCIINGMRIPHANIKLDDKIISTLDLCEDKYVLLLSKGTTFESIKDSLPLTNQTPVKVYTHQQDFFSADNQFDAIYKLNQHHAILIRPDGHVAHTS